MYILEYKTKDQTVIGSGKKSIKKVLHEAQELTSPNITEIRIIKS